MLDTAQAWRDYLTGYAHDVARLWRAFDRLGGIRDDIARALQILSPRGAPMGDIIPRLDMVGGLAQHCAEQHKIIVRALLRLPDPDAAELLRLRYLCGLRWDDVADCLHYDIDAKGIYKAHLRALDLLAVADTIHALPPTGGTGGGSPSARR